MKKLLFIGLLMVAGSAAAQVYVQPHVRSDGTYVQGHYRSAPNSTTRDNYSTYPNVNPYTGRQGTQQAYPSRPSTTWTPPSYPTVPPTYRAPDRRSSYEQPRCLYNCF